MFGLGMPEILLILAIALIVIGPKKLPELAKTLGRAMGEFKRSAQDFKRSIDVETTLNELDDVDTPEPNLRDVIKKSQKQETENKKTPDKDVEYPSDDEDTESSENTSQPPPDNAENK